MSEPRDLLREWAIAERIAIQAEEMLRAAVAAHLQSGQPAPSLNMQTHASELRQVADKLFAEIRKTGVSGS